MLVNKQPTVNRYTKKVYLIQSGSNLLFLSFVKIPLIDYTIQLPVGNPGGL